jgi:hypothetical protein
MKFSLSSLPFFFLSSCLAQQTQPPSLSFNQASTNKQLLTTALSSWGILTITDIPEYESLTAEALRVGEECITLKQRVGDVMSSNPTVSRRSAGSLVNGGQLSPDLLSITNSEEVNKCLEAEAAALNSLRSLIDEVIQSVASNVGYAATTASKSAPTPTQLLNVKELVAKAEGIEHLHVYENAEDNKNNKNNNEVIQPFHTDAGLLIAMTFGSTASYSLEIRGPSSASVLLKHDPRSLIVMVGDGAQHWLGLNWNSVEHRVVKTPNSSTSNVGRRAWYGRMYFLPSDFEMPLYDGKTFEVLRASMYEEPSSGNKLSLLSPRCLQPAFATGGFPSSSSTRELHLVEAVTTQCTADDGTAGIRCWTSCVSVAPISETCGAANAVCWDSVEQQVVDGTIMCPSSPMSTACDLACLVPLKASPTPTDGGGDGSSDFCVGEGLSMYMDGFKFASFDSSNLCLNMLFPAWTLNDSTKFGLGCFGFFALSVLVEWIKVLRKRLYKAQQPGWGRKISMMVIHGLHAMLGYVIMLAAMTYSIEMLLSVVAGLSLGFGLFTSDSEAGLAVGGEPCCIDFDYDEIQAEARLETRKGSSINMVEEVA